MLALLSCGEFIPHRQCFVFFNHFFPTLKGFDPLGLVSSRMSSTAFLLISS